MSPDGHFVAFIEVDLGIEGGVTIKPPQPVGLVVIDTTGVLIRRITDSTQRYAWCGSSCVGYVVGPSDETDLGFRPTAAKIIDVSTGVSELLAGPPWPTIFSYAIFDSSLYIAHPTVNGFSVRRYKSSTHQVTQTTRLGVSFSEDGRFYLSLEPSGRPPRLVESERDQIVPNPKLDLLGVAEMWLPSGDAHLLIRRAGPHSPAAPRPNTNGRPAVEPLARRPLDADYLVYDAESLRTIRSLHGLFPKWGSPHGVVPFLSEGRINAIARLQRK